MTDATGAPTATAAAYQQPKNRLTLLKFLIICLPLWLSAKFYGGPFHEQVGNFLAGIFFLICWALVIQIILPRLRETPLLIALFLLFCTIELLAWQSPELLQGITLTLDNRTVIGDHYSLNKIPYYGVGAFIGYFILKACRSR
ncbi:MAG: DUF2809 domain-containing protein [Desulfofustis sp.]|nr:DUF2809 domain-containing protein [Desulfofustis sp.]